MALILTQQCHPAHIIITTSKLKGVVKIISPEALLLTTALSIDALAASFAYGSSKIKIPLKSILVITVIGRVILGLSLFLGMTLRPYIPAWAASGLSFGILLILGIIKIFDSVIKNFIRKRGESSKKVEFSIFNLKFILNVYANPEKADIDSSRTISPKEAVSIAVALALDAFAVGFGAGLVDVSHLQIIAFSFILDAVAIILGCFIGNKLAEKSRINLSWLGGVILIALAFF